MELTLRRARRRSSKLNERFLANLEARHPEDGRQDRPCRNTNAQSPRAACCRRDSTSRASGSRSRQSPASAPSDSTWARPGMTRRTAGSPRKAADRKTTRAGASAEQQRHLADDLDRDVRIDPAGTRKALHRLHHDAPARQYAGARGDRRKGGGPAWRARIATGAVRPPGRDGGGRLRARPERASGAGSRAVACGERALRPASTALGSIPADFPRTRARATR